MSNFQPTASLKLAINLLTEKQKSLTSYLTALGLLGNQQTLQQLEAKFTQAFNKVLTDHQILKSNADIATVSFQQIENKLELLTDNYQIEKEKYDSLTSRRLELTNLGKILTTKKQALESGFTKNQAEIKTSFDLISQRIETAKNKLINETNAVVKAGIQKEINGYLIELENTQELLAVKNSDYQKQVNLLTSQITKNSADLKSLEQNAIPTQQKELATVEKRLTDAKSVYNQQQLVKTNANSALQNFENVYATFFGIAPKNQSFSPNYALKFDGVDDYLESPSSIIPTQGTNHPFTVSVWAKIDLIVQAGLFELVSQGTSGNAFYLGGLGGKIRVGDTWSNTGVNVPSDGLWHLYTVVRDTNNTHLYIDGELKASKGSAIANPANTKFWVGRQYLGGEFPKATIADISVWNTALSSTQVQTMPKGFLSGGESGLVGYWKLNEGTGNIAKDKSLFQRNLTIQGASWASDTIPDTVKLQQQFLTLQELEVNQQRLTALQSQVVSEESVNVALQGNTVQSYVTLIPQLGKQIQGLSDIWLKTLQDNHDLTVKVYNQQQNYSKSFDDLTKYIETKLADPDGNYAINEVQLNEAIVAYDILGQRRDALARSVGDTENVVSLLSAQVKQVDELNQKIKHIQDLTQLESFYANLDEAKIRLQSINNADYDWVNTNIVKNVESLFLINKNLGKQQVADNLQKVLSNYTTFFKSQNQTYTNLYQSYISAGDQLNIDLADISNRRKAKENELIQKYKAIRSDVTGNYYFLTSANSWFKAQAEAVAAGGNLVTINNQQEQNWIYQNFLRQKYWIGLSDHLKEGEMRWINGEPVNYTNWMPNEPNNFSGNEDFVYTDGNVNGLWNDSPDYSIIRTRNFQYPLQGIVEFNFQQYDQQEKAARDKAVAAKNTVNNTLQSLHDQGIRVLTSATTQALSPLLISNLSDEINQQVSDLVIQIDLPNQKQQEKSLETSLQTYVKQKQAVIVQSGINDKAIADLQSLRLETAYLILEANKEPNKVQAYLQEYFSPFGTGTFNELINTFSGGGFTNDTTWRDVGDFADVNGDGKQDYIVPWNNSGKRALAVYLAKGDGTFNEFINTFSSGVFTPDTTWKDLGDFADVNGDGKQDYIVPWNNSGTRALAVYLSKGDGTFNELINTFSGGGFTNDTTWRDLGDFADVNGDGKQDYIVPWNNSGKRALAVYLAKGDGTFNEFINTFSSGVFTPDTTWKDLGDFADVNGDGKQDYIVPWNNSGTRALAVYLSKGDGTFNELINTFSGGGFTNDTTWRDVGDFADVNGDGKQDYIVPWNNSGKRALAVYLAKGDGTFNEFINTFSSGVFTPDTTWKDLGDFADVNGDGKQDYIVPWNNSGTRALAVYLSKGDGTFNEFINTFSSGVFTPDTKWRDLGDFADVNGDGKQDYIVPWNNGGTRVLAVYLATKNIEFIRDTYFPELSNLTTLATLQQQITSQLTQSQQQLETVKNTITQQQAAANAALSQANWYEQEAPTFWERSHKQGAFWIEYRTYKEKKWYGRSKTRVQEIRHVDHDWIIWDTYTKQAANLKQYAADLLKGVETNTTQQNTVTTILTQWNAAKSIADDAQLTYDQLLSQLQLLEAERQLTPEKQAQLATLEKLLPTLKTQLAQAQKEVTTAKAKVTQEWGEYQTSADTYQTALNDILKRKATLETQSQQLLQEIKEVEQWVSSQTTAIDTEIQTTTTLKQQLKTQLDEIAKKLVTNSTNNDLLSQKTQLQEAIQLLTHKETILTAQKATLTQKQTLLTTQKDVIQNEQKLLLAYLVSPDNDTSNLEKLLQDSRAALAEAQRLAQQAEASSQVLTASMENLQTFLQLQNDKYLTAVKDKQNALKAILDATELKENYTLKAAQKQEELNTLSTQALQRLKEASDAGSKEAKTLLDVARNKNIATAAELYYKDYSDLASDKGGACAAGLARPEDRILADHYYAEMVKYKDLEKLSQQQANQFAQIRTTAETQLEFLKQQQNLASKELADLKASIGNTQNIIDAQKQALNVAQLRVEALSELRNWTEQTLNQVLQVEKLNLAQAKIEQTIAQQRQNGIDDAIAQQLERDRLSIDRQKAIATVKLEQLTQITAEDTLQQALNDLRSDLGLTPIEDFIQKAEWKADLAGILVDIEALKQKKEFSTDLKNLLNATSQDIHTALQGKEAKTIQDNLLKTTDALIKQTNSYSSAITILQQEEQTYLTLQQKATTDLQGATKLLLAEIEKTGKLDSEKQLLTQQNLEALYKVANAKNAGEISTGLAKQSLDILNQIIDGRIQERKIREKAFVNELLGAATLVVAVVATVLTAGAAAAGAGLIGTTVVGGATVLGVSTTTISSLASTFSLISSSLSAVQSAYNGDWAGAIFNAAMAYATFEINAINTELAQNADVVNATKAIDVAKKADNAKLVTELTQKLENLKYTLSPNLLDLKRFQSVAQGSYNAYKYAETGDTKLALLSGIQGLANAASLGIADLKDLSKVSDAQKFFITAGQVSLVTAEGVKAIEDGNWLEAAKAISSIARTIDKNFALGLGEAGKKELTDITGLKWEEIQDLRKLSSALYQSINNEDWIKVIQAAGKAINLVDDSLLGIDLETESHEAIKELTGFEWAEIETIIQAGGQIGVAVKEHNLETITKSVKSIVNVWVNDDNLKAEAQKITGLSWAEIQRITNTGEAINKAIEQGNTAAWIKSSNELLGLWQGNQTLQNFLKSKINLEWKDFEQVVKAGQSVASTLNDQNAENWGQSIKQILNIWYDDATLKEKLSKVSGLSWEQIQKAEETISILNKANSQGNTLAWVEASNKFLSIWSTDKTLANKIKANTGLDWQDFEKIVKAGQATAIAVNDEDLKSWGQAVRYVANIWVDDATLKSKIEKATGLTWTQLNKIEESIQELNKATKDNNPQAWNTASDNILKIWKDDNAFATKLKEVTNLDFGDLERIVKAGQVSAIAINSNELAKWGQAIRRVVNIWVDDTTLKSTAVDLTGLSWEQLQKLDQTVQKVNTALDKNTTQDWVTTSDEILTIWKNDTTLAEKLKTYTDLDWLDIQNIVKAGQETAKAIDQKTIAQWGNAIKSAVNIWVDDKTLKAQAEKATGLTWQQLENLARTNRLIAQAREEDTLETWKKSTDEILNIWSKDTVLTQKLKEKAGIEWKDVEYIVKSGQAIATVYQAQTLENLTAAIQQIVFFGNQDTKLKEKIDSLVEVEWKKLEAISQKNQKIQEGLVQQQQEIWVTTNKNLITILEASDSLIQSNVAPIFIKTIPNQAVTDNKLFTFTIPENTFIDIDKADILTYSATDVNGNALPKWLTFDAKTRTFNFNGTSTDTKSSILDIKLEAKDSKGASSSKVFSLNIIKPGVITFNAANYSVNEDGKAITAITLTRTNGSDGAVSVTLTPSNVTATAPADFNNTPIVVNFANGETSKIVTIPIVNDTVYELSETVNLSLSNPTNSATLGTQKTAVLTVVDNDLANAPKINITNPTTVIEGLDANAIFTVNLSAASPYPVTVKYTTANQTAIAGSDYTATSGTLSFAANETSKTITVPILNDNLNEAEKTFTLTLSNPTNANLSNSQVVATISDTLTASITTTLPTQVENLTLTGSAAINGTGNSLNNTITGNAAKNTISGGAGADILTGGLDADRFVYPDFKDSLLAAPDRITDFNPSGGDRIVVNTPTSLPTALFNAGIFPTASYSTLNAAAIAAYADANPNIAGTQPLAANQAVFFGWNGGTYLSVNDGTAAFNASSDLFINITGMTGTLTTGSLTTNNYFSV
ncbi:Calx-beta domain-containing protein [Nostoc sp. TCL26-01]|uniref:Calx-beta domain-containing protein n=1 Tax=Nostoc sp. TCL26-01 TaxID=2576904 RepID=UPI001C4CE581|nr:FG-GAP-like repeat-containing protein [Nostoc sp. TCL26-01]